VEVKGDVMTEMDSNLVDELDSLYYGGGRSVYSNKTVINKLEKQLNDEKIARKKLESEIAEIKKISSEISSHLIGRKL
jgi:predicted RNase H-like nuclease (RuvC/YqgF family)